MQKKIHLEWAKVYWPQPYEVVEEKSELIPTISLEHWEGEVVGVYKNWEQKKRKRVYIKLAEMYMKLKIAENRAERAEKKYTKLCEKYRKLYDAVRDSSLDIDRNAIYMPKESVYPEE